MQWEFFLELKWNRKPTSRLKENRNVHSLEPEDDPTLKHIRTYHPPPTIDVPDEPIIQRRIVAALPTILRRGKSGYLIDCLSALVTHMTPMEKKLHHIVVMNAELDPAKQAQINKTIQTTFPRELINGLIEVVVPPLDHYDRIKDPCKLKRNFNDTMPRVMWRSKLVLDVAWLMEYCKDKGEYYLHLEDDAMYKQQGNWPQMILEFSQMFPKRFNVSQDKIGALRFYSAWKRDVDGISIPLHKYGAMIALLINNTLLHNFTTYILQHFDERPLDWMFGEYLTSLGKNIYIHRPSFFTHVGKISSAKVIKDFEKKLKKNPAIAYEDYSYLPTWEQCAQRKKEFSNSTTGTTG